MKRFLILLIIVIVGFSVNDVQKEYITLDWIGVSGAENEEFKDVVLNFEDASFLNDELPIPIYSQRFSLKNRNQNFRIVIENQTFKEINIPEQFVSSDKITGDIQVSSYKLRSGDNFKLELQIIPIKKEGDKLLLLESFVIKRILIQTKSAKKEKFAWKTESVLKSGKWVKISTSEKGIYKIPYSKLTEWGFSDPAQVNVFGSGGVILSENPANID
ncbi:MAG: hypothetical protein L3J54_07660, partial [Draconibacterium sp.]|nr:hypothetical protein [Draconibacterium sp.]